MRASQLISAAEVVENVNNCLQILPINEAQARPLTQLDPEQQREAWAWAVETAPDGKITGAHVQSVIDEKYGKLVRGPAGNYYEKNGVKQCVKCGELWAVDLPYCPYCNISPEARIAYVHQQESKPHVSFNSGNNEWYTPAEYIDAARRVMGEIDLDPASSELANKTVGASVYFTAEDDGLRYSWDGRVWMNPPYAGELIGLFTNKLANHYQAGDITEAIVLVNNATETNWFQTLLSCASAVCLVKGRIKFIDMDGNPSGAPLQGQAILYLGDKVDSFVANFDEFGVVLYGCGTRSNQE